MSAMSSGLVGNLMSLGFKLLDLIKLLLSFVGGGLGALLLLSGCFFSASRFDDAVLLAECGALVLAEGGSPSQDGVNLGGAGPFPET